MSATFPWRPPADREQVARVAGLIQAAGVQPIRDRPLGPLTTFGVGGAAAVFVEPADQQALRVVLEALAGTTEDQVPLLVVGRGSNLLVADSGFPGVALRLGRGFAARHRDGTRVRVGAAYAMPQLAAWTAREGLAGLEFAAAIPASVGGSVRMNAGAHGADMASVLVSAEVASPDLPGGGQWVAGELALGYRTSRLPCRGVVTAAQFELRPEVPETVSARLAEHRAWRRSTQPLRARSCGSTFTNPPGDSAGRIVEAAGGKGLSVGHARVSDKHANFVVVEPGGRAAEVFELIALVQQRVRDAGGPALVPEVHAVGEF